MKCPVVSLQQLQGQLRIFFSFFSHFHLVCSVCPDFAQWRKETGKTLTHSLHKQKPVAVYQDNPPEPDRDK